MPATAPIHADIDGVPAILPALSVQLPDGRTGWYQRSRVDCLRAAVATATQVPYDELGEIPNLRALHAWADGSGFSVGLHLPPDTPDTAPQWIGVSPRLGFEGLRHTLVGAYREVYFDPAAGWVFPGGQRAEATLDLEYAFTLEPKETPC